MNMKVFNNLTVSFRLRKNSTDNIKTPLAIYCRITLNNSRADFSTKQKVLPKTWDKDFEKVKDSHPQSSIINQYLETIIQEIKDCYYLHRSQKTLLTLDKIKAIVFDKSKVETNSIRFDPSIRNLIDRYIKDLNSKYQVKLIALGTLKGYKSSLNSFRKFLQDKSNSTVINIDDLNSDLFFRFEHHLLLKKKISSNSTHKIIKHVGRAFNYAYRNQWIEKKIDIRLNVKYKAPTRPLIAFDKIRDIFKLKVETDYLQEALDVLKFQLLTGIAYGDIKNLSKKNIVLMEERTWIILNRQKTGTEQKLIVLKEAQQIIEKYVNHDYCNANNQLLPIKSNQKYNEAIKIIQRLAGFSNPTSSHSFRHIYASSVALSNGMDINILKTVLGHSSIRETEHYSKLLNKKLVEEFDIFSERITERLNSDH